jgi:hypothetical protein
LLRTLRQYDQAFEELYRPGRHKRDGLWLSWRKTSTQRSIAPQAQHISQYAHCIPHNINVAFTFEHFASNLPGDPRIRNMSIRLTIPASPSQEDYLAASPTISALSKDDACPICYNAWKDEKETGVRTHCGHAFHRGCLMTWFGNDGIQNANTCPSCRAVCFPSTSTKSNVERLQEQSPNAMDISYLYPTIFDVSITTEVVHTQERF